MNRADKVIWTEGMFLRPHHFQQAERWLEGYSRSWGKLQCPYHWGFMTLSFDPSLLRQGKLAIAEASGMMPDGTPFIISDAENGPAPLEIGDNQSDIRVVLALPEQRDGRTEVIFEASSDSLARYGARESEVADLNSAAVGRAAVQFGTLRLRLMAASDLNAEWTALGVAHVKGKDASRHLQLDLSLIHISEPTRLHKVSRMPSSA